MEYEMINNINDKISVTNNGLKGDDNDSKHLDYNTEVLAVKIKNIAIADEMNKILALKRVVTTPASRQELDSLFIQCLETFITINNKGV